MKNVCYLHHNGFLIFVQNLYPKFLARLKLQTTYSVLKVVYYYTYLF
jgi:hypothetical protein